MTKNWTNTPHIDPAWANDFLLEARMRSYAGGAIAATLAEIDGHLAESGEDVYEAFGSPGEYAASLDLPAEPEQEVNLSDVTVPLLGVLGMLVTLWGVNGLKAGGSASLSWGSVASLTLLVAACFALVRWHRQLLGGIARSWGFALAFGTIPLATFVALQLAWRTHAVQVPAWPTLVIGVALLLIHMVLSSRGNRPLQASAELVSPIDGDSTGTLRHSRRLDVATRLTPFFLPLFTAIFAAMAWFI